MLKKQGAVLGLMAVLCFVFLLQNIFGWEAFVQWSLIPQLALLGVEDLRMGNFGSGSMKFLYGFLTHSLLHGGVFHLLSNLLFFWVFAAIANELLGGRWIFLTFFLTAIAGGILHTALNPEDFIPMLGASGVASGFAGLYLGMNFRWRLPDPFVWPISQPVPPSRLVMVAVLFLLTDLAGNAGDPTGIAYGAHIGGFVMGMLLGGAVVPMPQAALRR